jgi:hypothetical protein
LSEFIEDRVDSPGGERRFPDDRLPVFLTAPGRPTEIYPRTRRGSRTTDADTARDHPSRPVPVTSPLRASAFGLLLFLLSVVPAGAGPVLFSRLTPCPDSDLLVLTARDTDPAHPDTLAVDPATGEITWGGGPVRGLAAGEGDTVYAALLTGMVVLTGIRPAAYLPWGAVAAGWRDGGPSDWPRLRRGAFPEARGAVPAGPVRLLPERYHPLSDSTLVFVTDAERSPRSDAPLYDLHARGTNGTEYVLARNLELRTWVESRDRRAWAAAARIHRPDYGGEVTDAVLAGTGVRVESFEFGPCRSLLWDATGALWALYEDGSVMRMDPGPAGWTVTRVNPVLRPVPCRPGPPESLWVWRSPGRYRTPEAALNVVESVIRGSGDPPESRVVREADGAYRPVWGGGLTRSELLAAFPAPPVPGARAVRVRADRGDFAAVTARLRLNHRNGIALLRHVTARGETASELWWRFLTRPRWVRLAGPWGLARGLDPREEAPGSVDTPRAGH